MIRKSVYTGIFFWLLVGIIQGQQKDCNLILNGYVYDTIKAGPLDYASLSIRGAEIGTLANEKGYFELKGICPGMVEIEISRVGSESHLLSILVHQDTTLFLNVGSEGVQLGEITIAGKASPIPRSEVSEKVVGIALTTNQGLNLATSLENLPGVSVLRTGATIAKPMIRGMHSNRILLLNNGVIQEGQQWGLEHAPSIDPFTAEQLTVIKGAATLEYGSNALGGIIKSDPAALPTERGVQGSIHLQGHSNNRMGVASGLLEGNTGGRTKIGYRVQGTLKRGGSLQTPDYYLDNTGQSEQNFSWSLERLYQQQKVQLYYSRYASTFGIFSGAHIGNLTDLNNAIERGQPLIQPDFSYTINRPQQQVVHELFKGNYRYNWGFSNEIQLQVSRQFNRREEFDAHRPFGVLPTEREIGDITFEITTHTVDLGWKHGHWRSLRGKMGTQLTRQVNTADRGGLIPNYTMNGWGWYWMETWKKFPFPLAIEGGLRVDYKKFEVSTQGRDTLNVEREFFNLSAVLGFIYTLKNKWTIRGNAGWLWRPPHVNELYSEGVHHGSASYETGNRDLFPERALNSNISIHLPTDSKITGSLSLYRNYIQDFIYLQPTQQPVLTIRGAFPGFQYLQTDAVIQGLEWEWLFSIGTQWALSNKTSFLHGINRRTEEPLIYMPANQTQWAIEYRPKKAKGTPTELFSKLTWEHVGTQKKVPTNVDYAPPPQGYGLIHWSSGRNWEVGESTVAVTLTVNNLLNTRYRSYLNRLRYYADEMGRNLILTLKTNF
jgi:iron complex outermembrane receptor protein